MVKRRMGIMAAVLCICLCLMPCYAMAASISTDADCTLTIDYRYEDTGFAELPVKVYKIAEVSEDFQYTLTPEYANANVILNGVQTQGEWNVILATLESYILAGNLQADVISVTDEAGQVRFDNLETGLYLVGDVTVSQADVHCTFASTHYR